MRGYVDCESSVAGVCVPEARPTLVVGATAAAVVEVVVVGHAGERRRLPVVSGGAPSGAPSGASGAARTGRSSASGSWAAPTAASRPHPRWTWARTRGDPRLPLKVPVDSPLTPEYCSSILILSLWL